MIDGTHIQAWARRRLEEVKAWDVYDDASMYRRDGREAALEELIEYIDTASRV